MSQHSFLELCRDKVLLCHDRDLQDRKFSISRYSVLSCDNETLCCVATRLDTHDKSCIKYHSVSVQHYLS